MRLIDADAFAEFLKDTVKRQKYEDTKIDGLLTVADVIEAVISELDGTSFDGFKNAPTIETERPKSKWVDSWRSKMDGTKYWYRECDHCGYERNDCNSEKDSNFCPNCGARMEETNETD